MKKYSTHSSPFGCQPVTVVYRLKNKLLRWMLGNYRFGESCIYLHKLILSLVLKPVQVRLQMAFVYCILDNVPQFPVVNGQGVITVQVPDIAIDEKKE
ncbi:unnamed protein product [Dibothriocephalus latus]|uniref:Uncharacterized protein n=1 Tax=Dibothriocephalus latus TaxID=60516 RepID=A0A3P7PFB6_DIBLA|nr:unnamed protein product [Dibothriocephalus latus]